MADHHHHPRFAPHHRDRDSLERPSRDRVDPFAARDRDRDRDRDREGDRGRGFDRDKDRLDHERDREVYAGRNNGHGVGLSSLIVRADSGGSAGFGRDSYDHADGGQNHRHGASHYDREERFAPAGINGGPGADAIYISNLSENVTEDSLAALLSEAGAVKVDRKTGVPMMRIYRVKETGIREAEVILDDPRAAIDIANWLDGYDFEGSKIRVSFGEPPFPGSSPRRHRRIDSYGPDYERDVLPRGSGYRGARGRGRGRGRARGRGRFGDRPPPPFPPPPIDMGQDMPPFERGFGGPGYGPPDEFPAGDDSFGRNNPNVAPREGDWICPEPTCGNLNFARRTYCNNCNKPRREISAFGMGVAGPPAGFQGAPPHPDFMGGPPAGRGIGRGMSGFGPPPGGWGRGGPRNFDRDFNHGVPPRMNDSFRPERDLRERPDYHDKEDYRDRERFERSPMDRGFFGGSHRGRERNERYHDKRGPDFDFKVDKRQVSPPNPRWGRDIRERSKSPVRGLQRNFHLDQRRDDRRDERRDR